MLQKQKTLTANNIDAEIADVLIALSVITRQLAKKITGNHMAKEETANEEQRNGGIV